jgi:hypothetical protein
MLYKDSPQTTLVISTTPPSLSQKKNLLTTTPSQHTLPSITVLAVEGSLGGKKKCSLPDSNWRPSDCSSFDGTIITSLRYETDVITDYTKEAGWLL